LFLRFPPKREKKKSIIRFMKENAFHRNAERKKKTGAFLRRENTSPLV
jgi:hypothetical protein